MSEEAALPAGLSGRENEAKGARHGKQARAVRARKADAQREIQYQLRLGDGNPRSRTRNRPVTR